MALIDDLAGHLGSVNVRAFLHVIRVGEGTPDIDGYRRHFGGELFDSLADHPRRPITKNLGGKPITSTAAGAYQFLARTWDECRAALNLPDFLPQSQDLGALFLIRRRGALADVLAGRLDDAIRKCAREWASLPGSPYGQPTKTLEQARATWASAGGQLLAVGDPGQPQRPILAPVETRTPISVPKESSMSPFVIPALNVLMEVVPALGRIFSSGSKTAERNLAAADVIVGVAKEAVGARNEQEMIEMVQSDPAAAQSVRDAVQKNWFEITDVLVKAGEADEKSRVAAADRALALGQATGGKWIWLLGGIAGVIVLASYGITMGVMFSRESTFSDETKALLLGQVVIFGFVTVLAFLFGSNIQNRIADQATQAKT